MWLLSKLIKIQEFFLLGLGVILFGIVGALSLASIDSVPEDLVDNAAVLGALCLVTALIFIGDLLMSTPRKKEDQARIIEKDLGKAKKTKISVISEILREYKIRCPHLIQKLWIKVKICYLNVVKRKFSAKFSS